MNISKNSSSKTIVSFGINSVLHEIVFLGSFGFLRLHRVLVSNKENLLIIRFSFEIFIKRVYFKSE